MPTTPNPTTPAPVVDAEGAGACAPSSSARAERPWNVWVGVAIGAHVALTLGLAFARYQSVHQRTFDLALYARMAWGSVHGQPWDPIVGGHFLGGHVPLVLAPLGALGALFGVVPVLLVAQSLAVGLSAWPLYRIGCRRLGSTPGALVAFAWLLQPNLGHVATYEMHPGTLALWPMCAAFDALDRRRPQALLWLCILVLTCRASLALQTCMLGMLACLSARGPLRRAGVCVTAASLGYFAFAQFALPASASQGMTGSLDLHFARWGGSPAGVLGALVHRPLEALQHFSDLRRLSYPLRVLGSFAFLPLLRPRWLLCAAAPLALNLISEFPTTTELYSHYLTPALPALAFGAIEGLTILTRPRQAAWCLLLAAALANVLRGGLPWSLDFPAADFRSDASTRAAREVLAQIPENASVQAPDPLLPHLSERPLLARVPPPERGTAYVALDVSHRARFAHREDLLRTLEEPVARAWLARPDHTLVAAAGNLLLLRRGAWSAGVAARYYLPKRAEPDAELRPLTDCLALTGARLGGRLTFEFVAWGACPSDLALRFGSRAQPSRVDLLFDGLLSPARLRAGDRVRSTHDLDAEQRRSSNVLPIHVGVIRANGRPPNPRDPISLEVPLSRSAIEPATP